MNAYQEQWNVNGQCLMVLASFIEGLVYYDDCFIQVPHAFFPSAV
jgi:hypothetical protein